MSSPTARSLKRMRDEGWTACVVEKWNSHVRIRQDAFGFGDILAFRHAQFALVQTTTATNAASRIRKIEANDDAKAWSESGGVIIVHGWRKSGHWWYANTWDMQFAAGKWHVRRTDKDAEGSGN